MFETPTGGIEHLDNKYSRLLLRFPNIYMPIVWELLLRVLIIQTRNVPYPYQGSIKIWMPKVLDPYKGSRTCEKQMGLSAIKWLNYGNSQTNFPLSEKQTLLANAGWGSLPPFWPHGRVPNPTTADNDWVTGSWDPPSPVKWPPTWCHSFPSSSRARPINRTVFKVVSCGKMYILS